MSRKKCRRKVWELVNPIEYAIAGARITPEALLDQLRTVELQAIDAFASGHATLGHFKDLARLLNLTEYMAKFVAGPEALPACELAQLHLIDAKERFERIGRMGLTGPGLEAMRELYRFHEAQRLLVDRSTYDRAIQATINRIRSKSPEVIEL